MHRDELHREEWKDMARFIFVILFICFITVGVVIGIAISIEFALGERSCLGRWGDRGSWSFFGGCVVQTENGVVPEDIITFGDLTVRERP